MEITDILKDFYKISGIRISIYNTDFVEIYSYPQKLSKFCSFIQQFEGVFEDCIENDKKAFKKVKNTGEVYIYKCDRGLYEAVAPIYNYGVLSGYLIMGQICDFEQDSKEYLINKTARICGNRDEAQEICDCVKQIDKNLIYSYINIMTVLAEYLTRTNKVHNNNSDLPELIKEYINKNFSKKITLNILSQKFGCCNTTLTKCFKNRYNLSIMEYLLEVRLNKAEELIVNSAKSFKTISGECGFYDQNYFSKTFTAKKGYSPTQYREKFIKK